MLEKEITFDRVVRWLIAAIIATALVWLINRLSSVLLPFFIAWILAYMIYPFVIFLEKKCRLKYRVVSIVVALLVVLAVLALAVFLVVPPIIEESLRMAKLITVYFNDTLASSEFFANIQNMLQSYASDNSLMQLVQHSSVMDVAENLVMKAWNFLSGTLNFALGLLGSLIVILYLFFILMDYEKISEGWIRYIPAGQRNFASMVAGDVKSGMNAYFRGQALVALCVGILFAIGFAIIGMPMGFVMGLIIGVLNLVPYMQALGIPPCIILCLVQSAQTGQPVWLTLLLMTIVFIVVQTFQDMFLTPKIMGKVTGLGPAAILLSLSIWGALMGVIGMIIALPLTSLGISCYKHYVLHEPFPSEHR